MGSQQRTGPPVLVPLAAEIDTANCEQACDQLSVAFIGGAPVVIEPVRRDRPCRTG
jgi:hypothetical protein